MRNRLLRPVLLLIVIVTGLLSLPGYAFEPEQGDIIFHTSRSAQSQAVQQATRSKYSHMGLILMQNGKPYVYEASDRVKFTPLEQWIAQGKDGKYVVKRSVTPLTEDEKKLLYRQALKYYARPYDPTFSWGDKRMYCSELVWKIYDQGLGLQIGELQQLKDFDLTTPAVRTRLNERYGTQIPLEETVISPKAMFDSPLLTTVYSGK